MCYSLCAVKYVLYAKGHQRDSNDEQVQQVEVVSAKRSFVQERTVGRHLDENITQRERKTRQTDNMQKVKAMIAHIILHSSVSFSQISKITWY